MPFIPDTTYGVAYAIVAALAISLCIMSKSHKTIMVALVMAAHWITMRGLCVWDYNNPALWVLHDALTVAALAAVGWAVQSRLSLACASVFFAVMLFDQYWWLFSGSFNANAAVAEAGGYLVFAMMIGASIGISSTGYGGGVYRHNVDRGSIEGGGAISGRSALSRNGMAKNQTIAPENRRA
jgi:hypothetical protein